jgi:hypothetical protein
MSVLNVKQIKKISIIHKLKQEEFKDSQLLLYKFKDIQGLEFLFSNSTRTFEDFQVLHKPCFTAFRKSSNIPGA